VGIGILIEVVTRTGGVLFGVGVGACTVFHGWESDWVGQEILREKEEGYRG